jgi:nicotinamidase-related amidase
MAQNSSRAKRSEKGLLTPDNCVVAIIDLQPQMLFGVANFDRQTIINNNVALLKAAKVFEVPVVLSTVETKSFSGNMWPQIQAVFPHQTPIERSSMNSWDDKNFVAAIEKTGKKKIVLAGLWTETCVALPTVQDGAALGRRAVARGRAAHAARAGSADSAATVGASGRRVDGVPIRRAPHADLGRNQSGRARHAGKRASQATILSWRCIG